MEHILKQYQDLLAQVDDWFSRCAQLYPDKIACQTGCSFCCRSLFDITLLDACCLKAGFDQLPQEKKDPVLEKCRERLRLMRKEWPEFDVPYVLNVRPEDDWEALMPEDDETPCVLLGDDGRCLVYNNRPMTCRLHGIPFIDTSGEMMHDDWCTLNFVDDDPLELPGLRAPFEALFRQEVELLRQFTGKLVGKRISEFDTFIPTALLLEFTDFDWISYISRYRAAE